MVVDLAVRSDEACVIDIVESGEEGDVEVGKAQRRCALRGQGHRAHEGRVVSPDRALQKQREEADSEGQVETGFLTGETGIDRAEVTLEKQSLRLGGAPGSGLVRGGGTAALQNA